MNLQHVANPCRFFETPTPLIICVKNAVVLFSDHTSGKQRQCGSTEFQISLPTCCGQKNLNVLKNKFLTRASVCRFSAMLALQKLSTGQFRMRPTATHIWGLNAVCAISSIATHLVSASHKVAVRAKQLQSGFSTVAQSLICGQSIVAVTKNMRRLNTPSTKQLRFIKTNMQWGFRLKNVQQVALHTCRHFMNC